MSIYIVLNDFTALHSIYIFSFWLLASARKI